MYKILFISHDANRAGAQLLLLELITYFKNNSNLELEILLKNDGELYKQFKEIAPTYRWKLKSTTIPTINPFLRKLESFYHFFLILYLKKRKFTLIYNNTFTNGNLLHNLSLLNLPVITHVHELNYWIAKCGEKNLLYNKKYSLKYIAASNAVKMNLVDNLKISENRIEIIYEFIDFEKLVLNQSKNSLRNILKIPYKSTIVAACGAEKWRKGKDLFIPIAIQVLKSTGHNVHFVWIGGKIDEELFFDIKNSGFEKKIHFIEHMPNVNYFFSDFDIFLMLSRDDPFPIVNLEAGALGKPVLCFEGTGGSPELLQEFPDFIVPYLDLKAMADKILYLIENTDIKNRTGQMLKEKIRRLYDIKNIAPSILNSIKKPLQM